MLLLIRHSLQTLDHNVLYMAYLLHIFYQNDDNNLHFNTMDYRVLLTALEVMSIMQKRNVHIKILTRWLYCVEWPQYSIWL